MISEGQFYRVQAILHGRDPSKLLVPHKTRDNTDFPLRVIMRCGKCNAPFTGAWSKGTHKRYGYYFCRKRCVTNSVSIDTIDIEFKKLLKKYTPSERGIELYCKLLLKSYNTKIAKFQKIKNAAEEEIQKLHALRQAIIEKNLNEVFSDEIFKEQNAVVEEKLIAAQSAKNEALLDNYNIQSITEFIKKKISNLGETYSTSNLSQLRCLLRSIFLSGFTWTYPGCSNDTISPLYQLILEVREDTIALGDPTGPLFEPLLSWLENLRLIYLKEKKENVLF